MVDRLLASTGSTIDPWQRQSYRLLLGDTEHMRGAIGFMAATDLPTLLDRLKRDFSKVKHVKPEASRADSAEMYVVGTGFRG